MSKEYDIEDSIWQSAGVEASDFQSAILKTDAAAIEQQVISTLSAEGVISSSQLVLDESKEVAASSLATTSGSTLLSTLVAKGLPVLAGIIISGVGVGLYVAKDPGPTTEAIDTTPSDDIDAEDNIHEDTVVQRVAKASSEDTEADAKGYADETDQTDFKMTIDAVRDRLAKAPNDKKQNNQLERPAVALEKKLSKDTNAPGLMKQRSASVSIFERGTVLFMQKNYDAAEGVFVGYLDEHPSGHLRDEALLYLFDIALHKHYSKDILSYGYQVLESQLPKSRRNHVLSEMHKASLRLERCPETRLRLSAVLTDDEQKEFICE